MEDKKINWYLVDIIAKYHTAPLQTISYLIAYGTEIIGIILKKMEHKMDSTGIFHTSVIQRDYFILYWKFFFLYRFYCYVLLI